MTAQVKKGNLSSLILCNHFSDRLIETLKEFNADASLACDPLV
jgi:hypothetical protein